MQESIDAVLDFWFGELERDDEISPDRKRFWFVRSDDVDAEIKDRFGADHEAAVAGKLANWTETPRGTIALVILLDQFTRNLNRNSPRAFIADAMAQSIALAAMSDRVDAKMRPVERLFLYMPLMHAEDLELQKRAIHLFDRVAATSDGEVKKTASSFRDSGVKHMVIVERFGRFPHRNAVMGRTSTLEEIEFLTQPGSSF